MIEHIDFQFLSDPQVEAELGKRLKRRRVELSLNQSELAERAGLGRRTITAIENGHGSSLSTFIAVLRSLGTLPELAELLPPPELSPIAITSQKVQERKYPYKPRGQSTQTPWKWGDESP
jgi:transcriptional regulator with XRE-family HTH domain